MTTPATRLDPRFSSDGAEAVPWHDAQQRLAEAEVCWLVTVRADGRPHTSLVVPVWHDGRVFFHTGTTEQKYVNLEHNPHVLVLVGDSGWDGGLDVAVEGVARRVADHALLEEVAEVYTVRWDGRWRREVRDGAFVHPSMPERASIVFEVVPAKAFGHGKGDPFGQTTYRFNR